jgi:hypothetical protein
METKTCQNCKKDFVIEQNDFSFYEKIKVPPPTFCPECRFQRRMIWRNERSLYHQECAKCKAKIISIYSKEKPFPVYCNTCWFGDGWDPFDYAVEYDSSKSFLSQLHELFNKIPHLTLASFKNYNCEYTSWLDESKNCYLAFGSSRCEDILFSETLQDCKESLDLTNCDSVEYSYSSIYCHHSNNLQFCVNCDTCVECYFSFDLKGCQNCFLSYNLRHKNYMILNKQYSQDEWKNQVNKILGNRKLLKESLEQFKKIYKTQAIHRFADIQKSYNSIGNNIFECKNVSDCFDSKRIEDCQHITYGGFLKDCGDIYAVMKSELCYEGFSVSGDFNCKSMIYCGDGENVQYSNHVIGCKNLFGCDSLRKKSFCILNKQYSKEEYEKITESIIKELRDKKIYGEFFPSEMSPYGYNETMANVFFPMTKGEALKAGYKWKDDLGGVFGKATTTVSDLPNTIKETKGSILNEVIECSNCKKNYKIIEKELSLYNRLNIPIPDKCIDCRFKERLEFCLPRKLWHRKCMKEGCQNEFETSYAPDRPEIVYCERCYQQEVY